MAKKKFFSKRFDFPSFSVVVQNHSLSYFIKDEETGEEIEHYLPSMFFKNELGAGDGLLQINWKDNWGSHILLTNFDEGSLLKMFEFIGRAFEVPFFSYGDFPAIVMTKEAVEESIISEIDTEEQKETDDPKIVQETQKEELEEGQIMTGFIEGFPSRVDIRVDAECAGIYCPVCGEANNLSNTDHDSSEALGLKCPKCDVQLVLYTTEKPSNDTKESN